MNPDELSLFFVSVYKLFVYKYLCIYFYVYKIRNMLKLITNRGWNSLVFLAFAQIPPANGQAAAIQALPTDWVIYDEMTRAHRIANIRCCSVVTPVTVSLFCGPARLPSNALQEPASFRGTVGFGFGTFPLVCTSMWYGRLIFQEYLICLLANC